jgi:two-component system copper resistance phosphate regulon response regulator CusR
MKILLAEDEPKTGAYLQQGLSEAGFSVDWLSNGTDALQQAMSDIYDLLILDVMMPGMDGWQVLRQLRAAGQQQPVLFLTARDSIEDRVKGLELGADDYLIKVTGPSAHPAAPWRHQQYRHPTADCRPRGRPAQTPSGACGATY